MTICHRSAWRNRSRSGALNPVGVGGTDDELAHRPWRPQRFAALGTTEPGQVDCHQVRVLGEPRPHRLERQGGYDPATLLRTLAR